MTLYIDGRSIPCPRCSVPLPGWKREVLHDGRNDRVVMSVECACGFLSELERLVVEHRPVSLAGPGAARVDDPPASKAAAASDFTGRRKQILDALAQHGPLDALQLAELTSMDANAAARRALDLVERGVAVVHSQHTNARGSTATRWALKRRAEEAA